MVRLGYIVSRLLLLIVFATMFSGIALVNAQSEQGFTVTSVSLTNVLHPGQSSSQTQWLINIALNGGGQSLVGTLGNSTINYQGLTSVYPLQISGTTNPEKAVYIISNTNPTAVYQYYAVGENGTLGLTFGLISSYTSAPLCNDNSSFVGEQDVDISGLATGHVPTISRICVYRQVIGYASQISSNPNIQSSSTLQLTANGKQETLNVNYSQQSATSFDGLVQANWVGSLVTGNSAPGGNLYVAISNPQQSQWNVQSQSAYSTYTTSLSETQGEYMSATSYTLQTLPQKCLYLGQNANLSSETPTLIATCLLNNVVQPTFAITNSQASSLLASSIQIGDSQPELTQNNGQSAFVITLNNNFVNNQDIVLKVNGSFIGVVIPEGTPKIISATASPFNSGNNGTIIVNVKNIGNAQGSFYTSLNNCAGITTISSPKYLVSSGQSQQISIPIYTSSATQAINEQCNVTVTDYNGGGSSSALVNVQAKPANQCTPNTQSVQGDYICPCVSVNGVYRTGTGSACTYCPHGVIQNNGSYTCASTPPTIPSNITNSGPPINGTSVNNFINSPITQQVIIPIATIAINHFVCPAIPYASTIVSIANSLGANIPFCT